MNLYLVFYSILCTRLCNGEWCCLSVIFRLSLRVWWGPRATPHPPKRRYRDGVYATRRHPLPLPLGGTLLGFSLRILWALPLDQSSPPSLADAVYRWPPTAMSESEGVDLYWVFILFPFCIDRVVLVCFSWWLVGVPSFTGFFMVAPSFTGLVVEILSLTEFFPWFTEFYWVFIGVPSCTGLFHELTWIFHRFT